MNCICLAIRLYGLQPDRCIFSAEKSSAVWLQSCCLYLVSAGFAAATEGTWASSIKTPRSADPTQNFFTKNRHGMLFLEKNSKVHTQTWAIPEEAFRITQVFMESCLSYYIVGPALMAFQHALILQRTLKTPFIIIFVFIDILNID